MNNKQISKMLFVVSLSLVPVWSLASDRTSDPVRDCAARLLKTVALQSGLDLSTDSWAQQWVHVRKTSYTGLPLTLHIAELLTRRPGYRVTFASSPCTLIAGDVSEILGVTLTPEELVSFATVQYNSALRTSEGTKLAAPVEAAESFLRLVSPDSAARLLTAADEIPRAAARLSGKDREIMRRVQKEVIRPTVEDGASGVVVVRFFTWDELGGVVRNNTFLIMNDGRISLSRTTLATGVGAYRAFVPRL